MNFDRNTVFGFIVLALLFFGYFYFNNQQQVEFARQKAKEDSVRKANQPKGPGAASPSTATVPRRDSADTAGRNPLTTGTERISQVNNGVLNISFSNKGGQPSLVELPKFKAPDSNNVKLASSSFDKIDYRVSTGLNAASSISELYFSGGDVVKNNDGSSTVSYKAQIGAGAIEHRYTVKPNNYMIDFDILITGAPNLVAGNSLNMIWQNKALKLQKDLSYERGQSEVGYKVDGDYDHSSAASSGNEEFDNSVNWVAVKQQFFNVTLIAKNNFSSGNLTWTTPTDSATVVEAIANLKLPVPSANTTIPMAMYYGPTDYHILKNYGNDMEELVNLGSGITAFVKYINRWIILPVFDFFTRFTTNFGIAILLLTVFIRLLISPLNYSSYLSSAKMKVLRPEIEQLNKKYADDPQAKSMEQMKLYREAGVNPLGGCIPGLLQIPIFFALFSFFNSNVALRGADFLWAKDLSQYDSILDFGFTIPLFGDHISLFTITAVLTSFLISIYSMSMAPDQSNPVLKYMPYFFPIILLFVFNNLPAGLTWYYTVSNVITLILQYVILNYIIDHKKVLAKIELTRKTPKKKGKWAERMEQIQEQQKKMQEAQKKR